MLTAKQINQAVLRVQKYPDTYWQVENPDRTLKLGSLTYVNRNYPIVYWPDFRVAGTIKDITDTFRNAGINRVQVGSLYTMSNGQIGCPLQIAPISEQLVASCAFDPLNPIHQLLLSSLLSEESLHEQAKIKRIIGI